MSKFHTFFIRVSRLSLQLLLVVTMLIVALELCYRYYVVDFYKSSLISLNHDYNEEKRTDILVIGDSFSASQDSYVQQLKTLLPHKRIINASIPGTGIRQHNCFINKRIEQYQPSTLVYQVYAGNDLLDYRHPSESANISLSRKIYWWASDRLLVLGYINAKLPGIKAGLSRNTKLNNNPKHNEVFSIQDYNARSKMLFEAEPNLIEQTIMMASDRRQDALNYIQTVKEVLGRVPKDIDIKILVMPHASQTSQFYLERFQSLGARYTQTDSMLSVSYPLYRQIDNSISNDRISCINALSWLRSDHLAPDQLLFYENDPHLNYDGHEVVASALSQALN